MSVFAELKRRNVFRAGIAYVVASWLILQVADVILPNVGAPDWIFKVILLALAIGFPVAIVLAWVYEFTSEGVKRETELEHTQTTTRYSGRRLDFAIIALLVIALAYFAYDKFVISTPSADKSIAVLPFVSMSDDSTQEYFADGLSEELLNLLARIPKLRVIARTSSFSYKGKDATIADIARDLNVDHVLEGSVRKYDGAKVRIIAQLIRADDESHRWVQAYDVTLDDVFAVQDQIAAAVVEELRVSLLGDAPTVKEINPDAYALYLQARELGRQSTPEGHERSIARYREALDIDPEYAAAWAGLGDNYIFLAERALLESIRTTLGEARCEFNEELTPEQYKPPSIHDAFEEARCAAKNALRIDPEYAPAHAGLGRIAMVHDHDLSDAAKHLQRALQLEPTNSRIVRQAATLAANLHRLDDAIGLLEYALTRDPVSSAVHANLALNYYYAGRLDDAIAAYRNALSLSPNAVGYYSWLGIAEVMNDESEAGLRDIEKEPDRAWRLIGEVIAYHALARTDESDDKLKQLIDDYGNDWAFNIAYVLAYRGNVTLAFDWLEKARAKNDPGLSEIASELAFDNIRSDPKWLPFLRSINKAPDQMAEIQFEISRPYQP